MNNIVDNLQTKENLTYDHVYNKLLDLKIASVVSPVDNKAYKTTDIKGKEKEKRREPSHKGPPSTTKKCIYCKKHLSNCSQWRPYLEWVRKTQSHQLEE